jgi:HlyD family secretion protein
MTQVSRAIYRVILAGLIAAGFGYAAQAQTYIGYVEADYIRATALSAGRLTALNITRGQSVKAGELIARLDDTLETAQANEARARLAQAQAQAADLELGKRTPEIDVIQNQRAQAQAQLNLSRAQVARLTALAKTGVASREALDQAIMAVTRDEARVKEANSQIAVARLTTGRSAAIEAARANVEVARASLAQAEWRLTERTIIAAADGTIADIIYRPGEMVPQGSAIALIISPAYVKARFYVPQADLQKTKTGTLVDVKCDGCTTPTSARISYVAPDAEFTPPVIYSDGARDKLMFLIEATATDGLLPIAPGQPIKVTIATVSKP